MNESQPTTVEAISELVKKAMNPIVLREDGSPFIIVQEGSRVESLRGHIPPQYIERSVRFQDPGSFCEYVNRFKNPSSLIFMDIVEAGQNAGAQFTAVLDYHEGGATPKAARCAHTATYKTAQTAEWQTWMACNKKEMEQAAFAVFLEDNLELFQEPKGAVLLDLVKTLTGKSDVAFKSSIRLESGARQVLFDEQITIKGGGTSTAEGAVELPRELCVGIAPFQGAPAYKVRARFKHRIQGNKLILFYETIGAHLIVRETIMEVFQSVQEKTGILPLIGAA